jgi:hypothetical protein
MAEKTLREFTVPSTTNIRIGPTLNTNNLEFELKPSLINMVQATPFNGKEHEDASAHLQNFLEISSTVVIKNIAQDIILLYLFPFSLVGRAKQWFYTNNDNINTWAKCSKAFLEKFFPIGKTNALRGKISNFQQQKGETIPEAWEHFYEYVLDGRVVAHARLLLWINLEGS